MPARHERPSQGLDERAHPAVGLWGVLVAEEAEVQWHRVETDPTGTPQADRYVGTMAGRSRTSEVDRLHQVDEGSDTGASARTRWSVDAAGTSAIPKGISSRAKTLSSMDAAFSGPPAGRWPVAMVIGRVVTGV